MQHPHDDKLFLQRRQRQGTKQTRSDSFSSPDNALVPFATAGRFVGSRPERRSLHVPQSDTQLLRTVPERSLSTQSRDAKTDRREASGYIDAADLALADDRLMLSVIRDVGVS
jgi:hypothetical protein